MPLRIRLTEYLFMIVLKEGLAIAISELCMTNDIGCDVSLGMQFLVRKNRMLIEFCFLKVIQDMFWYSESKNLKKNQIYSEKDKMFHLNVIGKFGR